MKFKLVYYSGSNVIHSWTFDNKALCNWKKKELRSRGLCLLGNFRIITSSDSMSAHSKCYVRVLHIGQSPNENESYEMFGEYQDEWEKFNDQWLIVKRKLRVD